MFPDINCRICMDETYNYDNPLLSVCKCDGSIKWVHLECLNKWRATSERNFDSCDICKFKYNLIKRTVSTLEYQQKYMRYVYKMARDIILSIIAYQCLCFGLGVLNSFIGYFKYLEVFIITERPLMYYLFFGNIIGLFSIGCMSILFLLGTITRNNGNPFDAYRELVTKNIRNTSKNKECCKITIIFIGIVGLVYCFTYVINYFIKKHSDDIWRKELTTVMIVKPFDAIPIKNKYI